MNKKKSAETKSAETIIGSTSLEKSNNLTKKIKGALTYPGVIFSAMILIGILMFAFVVPTLAKTFKDTGAKLPGSTQFIISLGNFFSHNLIYKIFQLFLNFHLIYTYIN